MSHQESDVERALEALGVSKRFGDRTALQQVDFRAHAGQVHGLLGPNGAGKSTLLRVILGLMQADAGTVRVFGRTIQSGQAAIPGALAGFVDTPGFYPYLSARENLAVLARLDGSHRGDQADRIGVLLEQMSLSPHADVLVSGYSSGMRQRLGLAAAVLRAPRLLLLDEPTSSLDPAAARDVRVLVRRLAEDGVAVVVSSHDMNEIEELCTALTLLDHGHVIFSGSPDDIHAIEPVSRHTLQTSDDRAALGLVAHRDGVRVTPSPDGGLDVSARAEAMDAYIIALGHAGIAVRALERRSRSLEDWFLHLTGAEAQGSNASESSDGPRDQRAP